MIKRYIAYFFISILFGLIFYFITNEIIFSVAIFLIYLIYFLFLMERQYKTYSLVIRKTKECINFINNFIISISINSSVSTTFDSLSGSFSNQLIEQINAITHLNDEEKIDYLENYFQSPLYNAFLKLLKQFLYEGGNILDSSHILIFDSRIIDENLNNFLTRSKGKLFQFVTMWGLCFGILIMLKFFLGNYFNKIQNMEFFPYSIFIFFLVFLGFLYFMMKHFLNLNFINEGIKHEKIKR